MTPLPPEINELPQELKNAVYAMHQNKLPPEKWFDLWDGLADYLWSFAGQREEAARMKPLIEMFRDWSINKMCDALQSGPDAVRSYEKSNPYVPTDDIVRAGQFMKMTERLTETIHARTGKHEFAFDAQWLSDYVYNQPRLSLLYGCMFDATYPLGQREDWLIAVLDKAAKEYVEGSGDCRGADIPVCVLDYQKPKDDSIRHILTLWLAALSSRPEFLFNRLQSELFRMSRNLGSDCDGKAGTRVIAYYAPELSGYWAIAQDLDADFKQAASGVKSVKNNHALAGLSYPTM